VVSVTDTSHVHTSVVLLLLSVVNYKVRERSENWSGGSGVEMGTPLTQTAW
jgi:hypothetical protein